MDNPTSTKRPDQNLKRCLPYGRQWVDRHDIDEVVRVLKSDWLTQGPAIPAFEKNLCRLTGARYAVAVSSGTAALHIACLAAGIGAGDEVVTSPLTFAASANCVLYCGGKPVFVDIDEATGNIDPSALEKAITRKTKAVIPVHYAGHACDMKRIRRIAARRSLVVIEDAAHALGATYMNRPVGSGLFSDMTIFSFHPVKHITTGEGGAVVTNNKDFYEKLLLFRSHGITKKDFQRAPDGPWYYEMQHLGFNYRMTDIQAALGSSQLKKLGRFVRRRRQIVAAYNKAFSQDSFFNVPVEREGARSSYHIYPLRLKKEFFAAKKNVFAELQRLGIGCQVHYIPVYWQPYYRRLGYRPGQCPRAEAHYRSSISLPLFPAMTSSEVTRVIRTVRQVAKDVLL